MPRRRQFLMILTSKPISCAGVVQLLVTSTSKNAPNLSVFNDSEFEIAAARRRGASFGDILGSRSAAPARSEELTFPASEATKLRNFARFLPAKSHLRDHISWLTDLQRQLSV